MRHLKSAARPAKKNLLVAFLLFLCALAFLIAPSLPTVMGESNSPNTVPVIAPGSAYRQTNFVSDLPGVAFVQDPLMVNPWGISSTATSPFWVANNGTHTSTLYRGDVGGAPIVKNPGTSVVTIPGGLPTGTVANPSTSDFVVPGPCAAAPCVANFIFASITGHITAWDPNAPAAGSTTAVIAASQTGHVYTGLAVSNNASGNFLYAADFKNNNIDVFNSSFVLQAEASFPFTDPSIPAGFHPFNIQQLGGKLYVAYAKIDPMTGFDVEGVGNGYVRRFNFNGTLDGTFGGIDTGALNSPWGLAIAPGSFGLFSNALLVGNFGEGNPSIHAYNSTSGAFLGAFQDESGNGIVIDELWALKFGNGGNGGDPNTLYFTAGIAEEEHGLFGSLKPTTATATSLIQFSADNYAITESGGSIEITVTRDGDVSGTASVNYATYDESQPDHASQKSDYEITLGKVTFERGETSKTFTLLLVNDAFDENAEVINLILSNPTGAGTGLGTPNVAEMTILDDDTGAPTSNPIDDASFFVRQHYLDFLHREPDPNGFAFWTNEITSCGTDAQCTEVKRINVSAAFFLSIEFQDSGFAAYLTHRVAFGPNIGDAPYPVLYGQFMRDLQTLNKDVVFGIPGSAEQLEENKVAYYNEFVTRPEFVTKYPSTL
ncbi:MAG TPA: TIGR03118 family protein, partial [Chthoniobacterales bacterium]